MRHSKTVFLGALLLACGLAVFLFAARGNNENDIVVFGPDDNAPAPAAKAAKGVVSGIKEAEQPGIPGAMPIGSVVAWLKSCTNTPPLPRQWVECNGQQLAMPGSPFDGATIPNLNGSDNQEKRFLRGSTQSGAVGGAETHNHGFYLIDRPTRRLVNVSSKNEALHLPPYYEVTWIIRVL
jgi:hypothetical protein